MSLINISQLMMLTNEYYNLNARWNKLIYKSLCYHIVSCWYMKSKSWLTVVQFVFPDTIWVKEVLSNYITKITLKVHTVHFIGRRGIYLISPQVTTKFNTYGLIRSLENTSAHINESPLQNLGKMFLIRNTKLSVP